MHVKSTCARTLYAFLLAAPLLAEVVRSVRGLAPNPHYFAIAAGLATVGGCFLFNRALPIGKLADAAKAVVRIKAK